ncbi:MAG: hypothetical protein ACLFOY_15935 [Desulfatibacillaceae bacterium]
MKHFTLSKWHRNIGIVLAVFLLVQALTGLTMAVGHLFHLYYPAWIGSLHHEGGAVGSVYRIVLGLVAGVQVLLGVWIFARVHKK